MKAVAPHLLIVCPMVGGRGGEEEESLENEEGKRDQEHEAQ